MIYTETKPKKTCVAIKIPKLLSEWDFEKNIFTPYEVSWKSARKIWWKCKVGHSWEAPPISRSYNHGCPYCSGRFVTDKNSLATRFPKISKEWHPDKNGNLNPSKVSYSSNKKIWWKCEYGHEWCSRVTCRTSKKTYGCPYCSHQKIERKTSLLNISPKLAREWNYEKNGNLTPEKVFPKSGKRVWWKCKNGHEWIAKIYSRSNGNGCKLCKYINLTNGYSFKSKVEAFIYISKYKNNSDVICQKKHGKYIFDFFIISENKYVEVTSFYPDWKYWNKYWNRIKRKKEYIEKIVGAKFEFIQYKMTESDYRILLNNTICEGE
jgi:hypothetical protein